MVVRKPPAPHPDGYWREGNIEVVCARYRAMLVEDWQSFVDAVLARA